MIEIPRNTYSVSDDPQVEEYIKDAIEKLKSSDIIYYRGDRLKPNGTNEITENIARAVAKNFAKAGWFCRLVHSIHTGFCDFYISKAPFSSHCYHWLKNEDYGGNK